MYPQILLFGQALDTYFVYLSLLFSFIVPALIYRADQKSFDVKTALDLYLVVLCSSFLGARFFYILYQEPSFYFKNPLEMFYFWKGGFVFFGGFLGGLFGGWSFLKIKKENWLEWANFAAPLLALGYSLGRVSCFLAGCCYGKPTEAWYSVFMRGAHRHPTQLYAVFFELFVFFVLIYLEKKKFQNIFFAWMILHGVGRIFMETFRDDPRGDFILGLSVSTVVSLLLILSGAFGIFMMRKK